MWTLSLAPRMREHLQEMQRMHDAMGRLFDEYSSEWTSSDFPPVDVLVKGNDLFVTAEIPGVSPESIDVSVSGDMLTLRGLRKPEGLKEGEGYLRRERFYGDFVKTLQLPFAVEPTATDARFRDGVLAISLTRLESEKPRKITVKAG